MPRGYHKDATEPRFRHRESAPGSFGYFWSRNLVLYTRIPVSIARGGSDMRTKCAREETPIKERDTGRRPLVPLAFYFIRKFYKVVKDKTAVVAIMWCAIVIDKRKNYA